MRRRGPLAAAAPRTVVALGLVSAVRAVGTVLVAEGLARGIASVADGSDLRAAVLVGLIGAVLRAVATSAGTTVGARAGADLTARLRSELGARALGPGAPDGSLLLGAHRLDSVDTYCTTVLPSIVNAAVLPLVIGARILLADWVSALVIALTVPLVPLFMVLVGLHSRERVEAASAALERLSAHLVELARGLPVLVGLGRIADQAAVLHRIAEEYRTRTMATLRVVFLSSLVLELVATISVALVAVGVGLRLLAGGLPLWAGLLALILAPECYGALREVGAAFHAGDEGLAAWTRAREILDAPPAEIPMAAGPAALDGLIVTYAGRGSAVHGLDLVPAPGRITALVGRSGSGKSTVLKAFAGLLADGDASVTGLISVPPGGTAYLPQHPVPTAGTVDEELRLYGRGLADELRAGLLAAVGLAGAAAADPRQLSPGELRRLAFARVLARVESGAELVLLDEPTAHLDAGNRAVVEALIAGLAGRATVVLATHEPSTLALADAVVRLGDDSPDDPAAAAVRHAAVPAAAPPASAPPAAEHAARSLRGLGGLLRPVAWRFVAGGLLGLAAVLAAVALTAVSGWLIVRASEQPPIMFLLVAIVGVRFFGIARAGLRYAERLTTHDAVLRAVTLLRDRLWTGLAAHGARSRKLVNGATAVDLLIVAVDQVRDLVPRVLLPPLVGWATAVAVAVTAGALQSAVLPVLLLGEALAFLVAPALALLLDRAGGRSVELRGRIARHFASAVIAAEDLRGNAVAPRVLDDIRGLDHELRHADARRATARGLGAGLAVLACCATAVAVLAAAAGAAAPAPVVGILALLPLALLEPALTGLDGVRQLPALAAAWSRVRPVLRTPAPGGSGALSGPVHGFALEGVGARWSGDEPLVFDGVSVAARQGAWVVVDGPSGSGKSTLLTVLLGALPPAVGRYRLGGDDIADLSRAAVAAEVAWLPQDAHVFDSTLRGNLLLGRAGAGEQELLRVLDRVGLGALVRSAAGGLDLRVGAAGRTLSGGERARVALARTLLSHAAVVLLDEPTAHLDAETAAALMADLRRTLADRTVVLVSHRAEDRRPEDVVLDLAQDGGRSRPLSPVPTMEA